MENYPYIHKINIALKEGFEKVATDNQGLKDEICELRGQIINNLVEENKKMQKRINELEQIVSSASSEIAQTHQFGRKKQFGICWHPK